MTNSTELHRQSIVIDAACPLVFDDPHYLEQYREGGTTVVAPTVGGWEGARPTLARIAMWQNLLRIRSDICLVASRAAIQEAKRSAKLGIYFHLQGADPIEDDLNLIDVFKALGVGMVQLTYNVRNRVGDGCEEPDNAGLSLFGRRLVQRLNETGIIVDCSHTGQRTSLEAIECSCAPVVLSHSNVRQVHDSDRNVSDNLIKAIASSGGVIGVAGFPAMVCESSTPDVGDLVAHMDGLVQRVGIEHVALGLDYYAGQAGIADDATAIRNYEEARAAGRWGLAYPRPPHHYPAGIETPDKLANLTQALLDRGYEAEDIRKILGANWLRVMQVVWG